MNVSKSEFGASKKAKFSDLGQDKQFDVKSLFLDQFKRNEDPQVQNLMSVNTLSKRLVKTKGNVENLESKLRKLHTGIIVLFNLLIFINRTFHVKKGLQPPSKSV